MAPLTAAFVTGFGRPRRVAVSSLAVILLVVSCSADPIPHPTPSGTPESSATSRPSDPSTGGPPPSSADLIKEAVRDGTIAEATGYLYRFYALWGDERLPEEYRGLWAEDLGLGELVEDALAGYSGEEQALLRPFLVRPTAEDSYWEDIEPSESAGGAIQLARLVSDPACNAAHWARQDVPNLPVTVWGRCRVEANGDLTNPLSAAVGQVVRDITRLWNPMTLLMGPPKPDAFSARQQASYEVDEAGDGRLDIYVVDAPDVVYPRDVTNKAIATARSAPPRDGVAASGYLIVDPTKARSAISFTSTLAHEFFHVLGYGHNAFGMLACPYPNVGGTCAARDRESHWIVEASAVWAAYQFVPEGRGIDSPTAPYTRFEKEFLPSALSLSDGTSTNEYASWMWPLFMEQEHGGPRIIARTWAAFEGRQGWAAIQDTLNAQLSFEDHFHRFAIRVLNVDFEPGRPIDPRFQNLDPNFPEVAPGDVNPAPRASEPVEVSLDDPHWVRTEDIPDLWARYVDVTFTNDVKRVTFNFAGLQPNSSLDVDAVVLMADGRWELRELDPLVTEWCFDRTEEAVAEAFLILSNHNRNPDQPIRGDWDVTAEGTGCLSAADQLVYRATRQIGSEGDAYVFTETIQFLVDARLASRPADSPFLADLLNDGSTYQVSYQARTFVRGIGGCDFVTDVHGGHSGELPDDSVTGSLGREPDGDGVLAIGAVVEIPVTTTVTSCSGSSSEQVTQLIQFPPCDGTELRDTDPARIFDFHCVHQGPGDEWSVTGTVTLDE